jgi:hypothetical protein
MTVSFIGAASAEATSLTLPAHQKGDLIMILAARYGSSTLPTIPSGWNVSNILADNVAPIRVAPLGWKVASSSSETSGTWTNANLLMAVVYRDDTNIYVPGIWNRTSTRNSTSITYPSLTAYNIATTTLKINNPQSVILGIISITENTGVGSAAPSNMTNRATFAGASTGYLAIHDTGSELSAYSATTATAASAINAVQGTIELCNTGYAKSSGGFRSVNIRGGADQ